MNGADERLDELLSSPLVPVADNGFSARVMTTIAAAEARQPWLETAVLAGAGFVVLAALLLAGIPEWIENASARIEVTALPLAIAGLALSLTWSYSRVLTD